MTAAENGSYAIHLEALTEGWTRINLLRAWDGEDPWYDSYEIHINDLTPGLVMRYAWRSYDDEGNPSWESTGSELEKNVNGYIDSEWDYEVFWRHPDGSLSRVDVSRLSFPGELLEIMEEDGAYVHLKAIAPGSGLIEYEETSVKVNVAFPEIGFYSAPEARTDTWLRTWDYTGSNEVYLMGLNKTIDSVEWVAGSEIEAEILSGGEYAVVRMRDCTDDTTSLIVEWHCGEYVLGNGWYSININDLAPGLVMRSAWREWDDEGNLIWHSSTGPRHPRL